MVKKLVSKLLSMLSGLPEELIVFIISMFPIIELRGGLIAASALDIPMYKAIIICFVGNLIPIPFILLLITPIFAWLKNTKWVKKHIEKLEKKAMDKSDTIQKYEFVGLVFFVGIPLPGTGAWTGSLIAALLGIKFRKAFPAIILGLLLATTIMCVFSYGIPWILTFL